MKVNEDNHLEIYVVYDLSLMVPNNFESNFLFRKIISYRKFLKIVYFLIFGCTKAKLETSEHFKYWLRILKFQCS